MSKQDDAFDKWFKQVDAYNSMPTIEDAFAAGREAERAAILADTDKSIITDTEFYHRAFEQGQRMERERVLGIITDCRPAVAQEPFDDYVNSIGRSICDEITCRIKEQE